MADDKIDIKDTLEKKDITPRAEGLVNISSGYARGAVLGGIAGFLFAMSAKKKPVVWTLIGIVGGGYIGYKVSEAADTSKQTVFNFEGKKPEPRKFKKSR